jgi:DNA-binding response OmpR family regulator
VKPFAFEELLARMRTLLRCDRNTRSSEVCLSILDLEMDLVARTATRAGQLLSLTAKEFQVLAYLVHNAGTPVSRDTIAQQLWGGFHRSISLDNAIDVHIGRIRRKVDAEHPIKLIQTIRGLGFIVEPAPCGTHHV